MYDECEPLRTSDEMSSVIFHSENNLATMWPFCFGCAAVLELCILVWGHRSLCSSASPWVSVVLRVGLCVRLID